MMFLNVLICIVYWLLMKSQEKFFIGDFFILKYSRVTFIRRRYFRDLSDVFIRIITQNYENFLNTFSNIFKNRIVILVLGSMEKSENGGKIDTH